MEPTLGSGDDSYFGTSTTGYTSAPVTPSEVLLDMTGGALRSSVRAGAGPCSYVQLRAGSVDAAATSAAKPADLANARKFARLCPGGRPH